MSSIFEKGERYKVQMLAIEKLLMAFAKDIGWDKLNRGRRAHASIYGKVNSYNGVLDIVIEEENWDKLPNSLHDGCIFFLWCRAHIDIKGERMNVNRELFWSARFGELENVVPMFIAEARKMLCSLKDNEKLVAWRPSENPDEGSEFGPPRVLLEI